MSGHMLCGRTKTEEAMAFWRAVLPNSINRLGASRDMGLLVPGCNWTRKIRPSIEREEAMRGATGVIVRAFCGQGGGRPCRPNGGDELATRHC
jgi:hypothetical protein